MATMRGPSVELAVPQARLGNCRRLTGDRPLCTLPPRNWPGGVRPSPAVRAGPGLQGARWPPFSASPSLWQPQSGLL